MTCLDQMIVAQLSPAVQVFFARLTILHKVLALLVWMSLAQPLLAHPGISGNAAWKGELHNSAGKPLSGAVLELKAGGHTATAVTQADGGFSFHQLQPLRYQLFVTVDGRRIAVPQGIDLGTPQTDALLTLTSQGTL